MSQDLPSQDPGDRGNVTPLGARRTSVADLQGEVERLTAALQLSEQRRLAAEHRLAAADQAAAPPRRPRLTWRGARRALLAAGLVLGLLAVVDGVLTIAWQEPVTALQQHRAQAGLRTDLRTLDRRFAAAPRLQRETGRRRMRRLALALLGARSPGSPLGTLVAPRIGLKTVVVETTGHDALTKGPGHYAGTVLPGIDGTVGIAGHRTTYGAPFRHIDNLVKGSLIRLDMPYGRFTYRVTGIHITTPDDASSLRSVPGTQRLVLTACHPLYSAAKRIVVTARLASATPPPGAPA